MRRQTPNLTFTTATSTLHPYAELDHGYLDASEHANPNLNMYLTFYEVDLIIPNSNGILLSIERTAV
jgi:hypothetical protein